MRALLVLFLLLASSPAFAGAWSVGCNYTGGDYNGTVGTPSKGVIVAGVGTLPPAPPGSLGSVGDSTVLCYRYNNGDGSHLAGPFTVAATTVQIIYDPELNAAVTVAGPAMTPHVCVGFPYSAAQLPAAGNCPGMGALTGIEGATASQTATMWIGPGFYYLELAACAVGETCQAMIRGGGD